MTKEDVQGDCFVPRNDGKSRHNHSDRMKEGASIRHCEKTPEEKVFYFTKCSKGFSWQSSKLVPLNHERKWTRRLLRASQ
jgi:hypothetical protein